jgi:hypothetical protein
MKTKKSLLIQLGAVVLQAPLKKSIDILRISSVDFFKRRLIALLIEGHELLIGKIG